MAINERDVWAQIGEVLDPELDKPLDALGFVDQVAILGGEVTVRLRLPTYWCAPNFAYMMAADLRDRIGRAPGVERVTVQVEDHFASDEISAGVNIGQPFSAVFPEDADGELDELRRTFAVKAFLVRQEQLIRALLRAGLSAERITSLPPTDLRTEGADVLIRVEPDASETSERVWTRAPGLARTYALWRKKRAILGLPDSPRGAPCFTTADGADIPANALDEHLRSARMIRLNGVFNTLLCTGLHHVRYGSVDHAPEQPYELT
ncbi:MAG TPA: iron-sulfur cluster assembly protein [Ktedonobacterales bacterium]|jgi:metal-sulfur cluster biosynthetic enzyme|nr:iron-sulfur cluster assembly protein [Ktedonobacterales bacterium]